MTAAAQALGWAQHVARCRVNGVRPLTYVQWLRRVDGRA